MTLYVSQVFHFLQANKTFTVFPTLPKVEWATKATWFQREEPKESEDKVQYCEIDRSQLHQIEQYSDGEEVLVWIGGMRRTGWLAKSKKEKGDDLDMTTAD